MEPYLHTLLSRVHSQWQPLLAKALQKVDSAYLKDLENDNEWLPGMPFLLAAFQQPLDNLNYILLGESPYPRPQSANGCAFWDASVQQIWSPSGFSKEVNRATSLRNFFKMLLLARGELLHDFSQPAIAALPKSAYWQTAEAFFMGMQHKGFLLLNASLVYSEDKVRYHARHWQPFINSLFQQLATLKPNVQLILFGKIAAEIELANLFTSIVAEHPYNISFITNPDVLNFFRPLDLMARIS